MPKAGDKLIERNQDAGIGLSLSEAAGDLGLRDFVNRAFQAVEELRGKRQILFAVALATPRFAITAYAASANPAPSTALNTHVY